MTHLFTYIAPKHKNITLLYGANSVGYYYVKNQQCICIICFPSCVVMPTFTERIYVILGNECRNTRNLAF